MLLYISGIGRDVLCDVVVLLSPTKDIYVYGSSLYWLIIGLLATLSSCSSVARKPFMSLKVKTRSTVSLGVHIKPAKSRDQFSQVFTTPRKLFLFDVFSIKIKMLEVLRFKEWNYQGTKQNGLVLSGNPNQSSLDLYLEILLWVCLVTRHNKLI